VITAETYLQTEPPTAPSSLTHWRKRVVEAHAKELRAETIEARKRVGVAHASIVTRVIVDTTVIEGGHPSNLFAIAQAVPRISGIGCGTTRPQAPAEPQLRGTAHEGADWPLRSRGGWNIHDVER
jgi:hypothetical protein